jgi:general secretion pathway protein K
MKIPAQTRPQGIALFIVMIAIFVLSVMAAIFVTSMKVETKLAQNAEHGEQLLWLGRSGVELARYFLAQEEASVPYDSLDEFWAGGPGAPQESNSPLAGISLNNYQVGDGTVSVTIEDLDRKVNINTADPRELQQALNLMGVGADNISVISDSILDWISSGENPRLAGAKSDYYQNLDPPYYAKDAPMDDLSELLLVRGIWDHPEIYWGGSATNQEPAAFQQKLGFGNSPFQAPDYPFGLKDIFTTISSGRINILTAGTNVLQMLPGVDDAIAQNIVNVRPGSGGADGSENGSSFTNPGQILGAAGAPAADAQFCTVRSFAFEVHVKARIGDDHRDYTAILYRNSPNDIQVLSFYWK